MSANNREPIFQILQDLFHTIGNELTNAYIYLREHPEVTWSGAGFVILSASFLCVKWFRNLFSQKNNAVPTAETSLPSETAPSSTTETAPIPQPPTEEPDIITECDLLPGLPKKTNELPPATNCFPPRSRMRLKSMGNMFVGRLENLWAIHEILLAGKKAIVQGGNTGLLTGMGGLGKTQLAIEYVHRFTGAYPGGIFWINAEQGFETVPSQFLEGLPGVEIDEKNPLKRQLAELWQILDPRGPAVLVVYDNFPEKEELQPWLPPFGSISVLVTTRRRDITTLPSISLEILSNEEGLALLNMGKRQFGEEAFKLIEALGGLPLALELTRHYVNLREDITVDALLKSFEEMGEMKALAHFTTNYTDQLPSGHDKEVAATIQMSWELATPLAKKVLQAMACLAPVPVPRRLLYQILDIPPQKGIGDTLGEALNELDKSLALIDLDTKKDPIIHRLISGFVQTVSGATHSLQQRVIDCVKKEMKRSHDVHDTASLVALDDTIPHADFLLTNKKIEAKNYIEISDSCLKHFIDKGHYSIALKYGRSSLKNAQESLEKGDPTIARIQSNLALVLKDLGELKEARDLLQEALESDKKSYEKGHPAIATRQNNLAMVLQALGELKAARDLFQEALGSYKKSYEKGHPEIAIGQNNLAMVLKDLGELKAARDLFQEALDSYKKSYEKGHPQIGRCQASCRLF